VPHEHPPDRHPATAPAEGRESAGRYRATERHQDALEQEAARNAHPARADRRANRQLLMTPFRSDLHEAAQGRCRFAVPVARSWILHQRYARKIADELIHGQRPHTDLFALVDFRCPVIESERVQQKIAHGDRPRRWTPGIRPMDQ
jgi:hypothetical protein